MISGASGVDKIVGLTQDGWLETRRGEYTLLKDAFPALMDKPSIGGYHDSILNSEKIIALCQKRVVYRKDMKISWLAKFLSRFAIQHNSAGIGVGEVCKMQFAIDECGAWKVLWAAICAGFGKLVGKHGIFYDMVGMEVTGLDGFYPDVFPVYGDYGIRIPENPSGVCNEIYEKTGVRAMIVDANDFTRDILGKGDNVTLTDEQLCEIIRDNPAGQDDQCTPFILIRKKQ